jgi:hypothetical protein
MKNLKISVIILISFLFNTNINAQNTFPATGNVGIGTLSPAQLLDVRGNINMGADGVLMMNLDTVFIHQVNNNLSIGIDAASKFGIGTSNTYVGDNAGHSNENGYYNTCIGNGSGSANVNGTENTIVGNTAGALNTSGVSNTLMGAGANSNATSGSFNTIIGHSAGANSKGYGNCFFGYFAGNNDIDGQANTYIGMYAHGDPAIINASAIGFSAVADKSNSVILGAVGEVYGVNVGIGTSSPNYTLDVITSAQAMSKNAISGKSVYDNGSGVKGRSDFGKAAYGVHGRSASGFAGYFNGKVVITGNLTLGSDERLKENIKPVSNALSSVMRITPSTYTFKKEYENMNVEKGMQYGFIAQNVEKVFPELVVTAYDKSENEDAPMEYKTVNYLGMIPVLTASIQEQQKMIDELKTELDAMKLVANADKSSDANTVILSSARLEQNVPNPFNQNTVINYYVPQNAGNALIKIADMNGVTIKTISVEAKGNGKLTLETAGLSPGTYFYSLIVDGNIADTKQMQIVK